MHPDRLSQAYLAAREHAGLIHREHGLIVVSGADRASYLQGLLTNDVASLKEGHGCYAAYLTAQGRMITDLYVYELGDVILLVTPPQTRETVLARLDQFIFAEDVQLGDVSSTFDAVTVVGPDAARTIESVTGVVAATLDALPEYGNIRVPVGGQPVIVLRAPDAGAPGFELVADRQHAAALRDALRQAGAADVDAATADTLRIEAGIPAFGRDMDEETIPLEAGIENRAISFTKGCYVGQEVIIRVLHRGHGRVARRLVGLVFDGDQPVPEPATPLQADGKEIGSVTSSTLSPALERPIALAYVKRDFVEPGTKLVTAQGATAEVVALPFRTA